MSRSVILVALFCSTTLFLSAQAGDELPAKKKASALVSKICKCIGKDNLELMQEIAEAVNEMGFEQAMMDKTINPKAVALLKPVEACLKLEKKENRLRKKMGLAGIEHQEQWINHIIATAKGICPAMYHFMTAIKHREEK